MLLDDDDDLAFFMSPTALRNSRATSFLTRQSSTVVSDGGARGGADEQQARGVVAASSPVPHRRSSISQMPLAPSSPNATATAQPLRPSPENPPRSASVSSLSAGAFPPPQQLPLPTSSAMQQRSRPHHEGNLPCGDSMVSDDHQQRGDAEEQSLHCSYDEAMAYELPPPPPEALFLTGGASGPAEYNYYAPPLKWRSGTSNPREQRISATATSSTAAAPPPLYRYPCHQQPNTATSSAQQFNNTMRSTVSDWSTPPRGGGQVDASVAMLAHVGESPVVWTHEAPSVRHGRRRIVEDRERQMEARAALDNAVADITVMHHQHMTSSDHPNSTAAPPDTSAQPEKLQFVSSHVALGASPPSVGPIAGRRSHTPLGVAAATRLLPPHLQPVLRHGAQNDGTAMTPSKQIGPDHQQALFQQPSPVGALIADPDTTAHYPLGDISASPSVRHYYAAASVTPFQRVHIHKEEEMGRRGPSSSDAYVDSRRVWGPKDEPHIQGVYRAWWQ